MPSLKKDGIFVLKEIIRLGERVKGNPGLTVVYEVIIYN